MGALATSSATPPQPSDPKMAEAKPTEDLASPQATSPVVQSASRVIARQISAAAAVAEQLALTTDKGAKSPDGLPSGGGMTASSAEEGSDLIALVLARPEIKSLADLAGKRVR